MKLNRIILLLLLLNIRLKAQNFNIVSSNDTMKKIYWSAHYLNGNIMTYSASNQYYNTPYPYSALSFTEYDFNGNTLRDSIVGDTTFTITSGLGSCYKNGYYGVPGRILNINTNEFNKYSAFLIRGDLKKCRKLFVKADTSFTTPFSTHVYPESDNKIVMVGTGQPKTDLGTVKIMFYILDTLNNIIVSNSIGSNSYHLMCRSLFRYEDNYILIANKQLQNNTNDPTNLVIYKLDTLGNIVNTYQTTNGKWYGAVSSAVLPNGDFIVGGFFAKGFMSSNPLDGVWQQKYLARFDKNLNLIWRKTFGSISGNDEITKVMIASDSTIVGCGTDGLISYNLNDTIPENDTIGHGTGCLFKFSLIGDSIWMRKYQGIDNQAWGELAWLTHMDELPNNQGYVACGYIDNAWPIQRRGWVFRTDANGCLDASCTDYIKEIDDVNSGFELILSPNPANTQVNITYFLGEATQAIVTLSSTTGNQVYEEKITGNTGTLHLHTSSFSSGIYLLKLQNSNGAICMKKLMLMHE